MRSLPPPAGIMVSLGGEGSNLDSRLQRTLCCRYTTPDPDRRYAVWRRSCAVWPTVWSDAGIPATVGTSMGSLIKKRRKRMRKKKHKKLLKKTRWARRQQGK